MLNENKENDADLENHSTGDNVDTLQEDGNDRAENLLVSNESDSNMSDKTYFGPAEVTDQNNASLGLFDIIGTQNH